MSCHWAPAMVSYFSQLRKYIICGTHQPDSSRNYLTRVSPQMKMSSSLMVVAIYKVFVVLVDIVDEKDKAAIFSSRAHAWKTVLEVDVDDSITGQGTLLKEALHWLGYHNEIVSFDLAQEEEEHRFRKMLLPNFHNVTLGPQYSHLGVSVGGCLSLAGYLLDATDCIDVWVMREYDVRDSWTKLFNLKLSDPPKEQWSYNRILVTETSMVAEIFVGNVGRGLVKILKKEEDKCSIYMIGVEGDWIDMIEYQESLLRIDGALMYDCRSKLYGRGFFDLVVVRTSFNWKLASYICNGSNCVDVYIRCLFCKF
ncbi:uncharacterized protein LOC133723395 isoform X1 [Rosa rugosa]|uniref:uncharacterized protein LOC133723395 isoform X1 n=1 Tax=Rosa rugosa TaxID=74645 RepID=UPI002B40EF32|nr:uncharacterized protein LOC133723395 isoform X1 [Rosa rugosa]